MEEKISVGNETISVLSHGSSASKGFCISLHGGGPSTKETSEYLANIFNSLGVRFVSFDFSGQGDSSGSIESSSLEKRLNEAIGVIEHVNCVPSFVIGTSMGGYIAMKLVEGIECQNLILFCPAAYSRKSWKLEFGSGFTAEIRRENSYLETDVTRICGEFKGNVILFFGSEDSVIPLKVQDMYKESFHSARSTRTVILQNRPHPIHRWIQGQPTSRENVENEVDIFVRNSHLASRST
jgi:hypothetical protein